MSEDRTDRIIIFCPKCLKETCGEIQCEADSIGGGCDTCGYGSAAYVAIRVECLQCNTIAYKHEMRIAEE